MKEEFIEKSFNSRSRYKIKIAETILSDYVAQGFRLSLRQLYYQFVARGHIPNTQKDYKNLGNLISNARQAGLIDWEVIEDRNRETVSTPHWNSPAEIVMTAANVFRIDKWKNQPYHIEIMVEKDALSGVLIPVVNELDISITANKGYSSTSIMYDIGKRLARLSSTGKYIRILYLGDHDPSGIDMTRDIEDRLRLFSRLWDATRLQVTRLALNWDQVERWNPPENPAKQTDTRYQNYVEEFGDSSWELDAIEPIELANLIRNEVLNLRADDLWEKNVELENSMREELRSFADNYGVNND